MKNRALLVPKQTLSLCLSPCKSIQSRWNKGPWHLFKVAFALLLSCTSREPFCFHNFLAMLNPYFNRNCQIIVHNHWLWALPSQAYLYTFPPLRYYISPPTTGFKSLAACKCCPPLYNYSHYLAGPVISIHWLLERKWDRASYFFQWVLSPAPTTVITPPVSGP